MQPAQTVRGGIVTIQGRDREVVSNQICRNRQPQTASIIIIDMQTGIRGLQATLRGVDV